MTTTLKATAGVRWYTIFDEPLALWASKLLQSNELLQSDGGHVLTWPQVLQLRLHLRKKDFYNVLVPEGLLENRLHTGAACATLIHSQRCHIVNQNRGDVPVSVDFTAAALSMRGTQLTDDKASMEAVEALAQEKGYSSPFWLTLEEAEYFISGSWWLQRRLNCSTAAFASAYAQKKDICSVPVINDCGQSSQVVNLCEFPRINEVELGHRHHISALSAFRQFVPHNVFTGCPFSQKLQAPYGIIASDTTAGAVCGEQSTTLRKRVRRLLMGRWVCGLLTSSTCQCS
ncbi:hypothetical protein TRVL_08535 [Trypanosoma vivax]|nr:hypothetical protein TRVL_08535 [Trypanosoma vivax]